jgi:hypothetical protein
VFTLVFAVATLVLTDPLGRYGGPLPLGSRSFGMFFELLNSFDPLAFVADVVASALLMYPAWVLGRGAGVAIATYVASGVTIAVVGAAFAGAVRHVELAVFWLACLLVGAAAVAGVRVVRGVGSRR